MDCSWGHVGGRGAADVEEGRHDVGDGLDVVPRHPERRRRQADLLDKVRDLGVVQAHVFVDRVHGRVPVVQIEAGSALHAASQEGAEEGVQVVQQEAVGIKGQRPQVRNENPSCSLLSGVVVVGRQVPPQGVGAATVKKRHGLAAAAAGVGRPQAAVKVRQQVDVDAVYLARSQDARDLNADIGQGVLLRRSTGSGGVP